jgi:hypothetical protein
MASGLRAVAERRHGFPFRGTQVSRSAGVAHTTATARAVGRSCTPRRCSDGIELLLSARCTEREPPTDQASISAVDGSFFAETMADASTARNLNPIATQLRPRDRKRGKGIARPEQPQEPKQSWRAQAADAWIWAIATVAPSLLERSFRASTDTSCVGTGLYRGSSRFSITGCRSAGRSGHLVAAGAGAAATRFYEGGAGRQGPSRSALGHRPAEIDIAPLADARAQAGGADELPRRGEAADVAKLVRDGEAGDPAKPGRGHQAPRDVGVVGAGALQLMLDLSDLRNGLAKRGVLERVADLVA